MIQQTYKQIIKAQNLILQTKNNLNFFPKGLELNQKNKQFFGRNVKVSVKGFKSKLIDSEQNYQDNNQEDNENLISNKDTQEQKVDFRDIQLSQEDDKFIEQQQKKQQEEEPFTKDQMKFIRDSLMYKGDDPYPEKLVHRPEKGVVWGLGGELMKKKINFFTKGEWPLPEEVMGFLEIEQAKDIDIIDTEEDLNRTDLPKYIICGSTFSCVHNYRIAKNLLNAVRDLKVPNQTRLLNISGRKDDEWVMVDFNDIAVHLFVEESREEIGFEHRLRNPPQDEDVDEYMKIALNKKKQSVFEPLKDI